MADRRHRRRRGSSLQHCQRRRTGTKTGAGACAALTAAAAAFGVGAAAILPLSRAVTNATTSSARIAVRRVCAACVRVREGERV